MHKLVSYPISFLYYITFVLILSVFDPIQRICYYFFGYEAHKRSVSILNFFLVRNTHLLGTTYDFQNREKLPNGVPLIIVANHPFGGLEGVVMAHLLAQQRSDVKILANRMLGIFTELSDYFIYTNPLKAGASGNLSSLKTALGQLKTGCTLLV